MLHLLRTGYVCRPIWSGMTLNLRSVFAHRWSLQGRHRRELQLVAGAASRPHRSKGAGEDAFCIDPRLGLIGVADGVGGSKSDTADPGAFARRLLAWCWQHALDRADQSPAETLRLARTSVANDDIAKRGGSSTATVVRLSGGELRVANFGDSAAVLLRPVPRQFLDPEDGASRRAVLYPRLVLRTHDQVYYFNAPYQASASDDLSGPFDELGSCEPDQVTAIARPGDVVLVATDGLWDNVDLLQIQNLVAAGLPVLWASAARHGLLPPRLAAISEEAKAFDPPGDRLSELAAVIADAAVAVYDDENASLTPFAVTARTEGYEYVGGKEDDVTVVIALAVPDDADVKASDEASADNFGEYALPSNTRTSAT